MQIIPTKVDNYKKNSLGNGNFFSRNKGFIVTVLFYVLLYFLIDFSSQSLIAHDEGLYARRAKLLVNSDNWFYPPFSSPHHKTLGSYWLIALSIRTFGYSELALRLPSIIASFFCLYTSYFIALRITDKKSALISVFSLSSMPLWLQYSRYASPDILFVLSILLVILFFLKSLDSSQYIKQYLYIFISGFFISTSFFIRSYMSFVPLIGLTPFLVFHLLRKRLIFKTIFLTGISVGSIPTCINLFFSFQKFGINGITSLFDFAKKQAIGGFGFDNLLLLPLNFLYLTFPIGFLLFILFAFTRNNTKINYPLLTYCFPLLSLVILLCMSTSYPHYYLFLLPSLSILFSLYITSFSFRFSFSKFTIKYLLLVLMILVSIILLVFILNYSDSFIKYSDSNTLMVYFISLFLILSYISSMRFLFNLSYPKVNLLKFFYNLIIPQYISISLLFNYGILGNPNFNTKSFLTDDYVSEIITSNTIYLFGVDSKIQTLLAYYLPSSKIISSFDEEANYKYIITSTTRSIDELKTKSDYKPIKRFENHLLLMNISK